jgi:hypothetical protein
MLAKIGELPRRYMYRNWKDPEMKDVKGLAAIGMGMG